MVAAACWEGYLPMSEDQTGFEVLLVKCHEKRAVLEPASLHISRSTRRRSQPYELRIDYDFGACIQRIAEHYSERWLTPWLCDALVSLNREPIAGVRSLSAELYRGDELVAGEVGYSCGGVYTSLSGFHTESGSGSVQLAALGRLLFEAGYSIWDLGMDVPYKRDLGARLLEREIFLPLYHELREGGSPILPKTAAAAELLGRTRNTRT
jgi:leucyl/phenylalanyl-tRNA--protein transferase